MRALSGEASCGLRRGRSRQAAQACALALAALLVAGCLEEEGPAADGGAQTADNSDAAGGPNPGADGQTAGPQAVDSSIDWDAARADRAQASANAPNVTVQSAGSDQGPPPVPMLLPSGVVQAQNARPPAVVTTDDGYFATYQLPRYDAVVNGAASAVVTGAAASDRSTMKFDVTEGGAQLAFSRYGADYLIEFECRQIDSGGTCISEDEARAFADSLFVAQTR